MITPPSKAFKELDKETNKYIISAAGEESLEAFKRDIKDTGIDVNITEPMNFFCETILNSSREVMTKSANKHNRIYLKATPLAKNLVDAIENNKFGSNNISKNRWHQIKIFSEETIDGSSFDKDLQKKLWDQGPDSNGVNILVNTTQSIQNLNEMKIIFVALFKR